MSGITSSDNRHFERVDRADKMSADQSEMTKAKPVEDVPLLKKVKDQVGGIVVAVCCINLLLWFILLSYTVTKFAKVDSREAAIEIKCQGHEDGVESLRQTQDLKSEDMYKQLTEQMLNLTTNFESTKHRLSQLQMEVNERSELIEKHVSMLQTAHHDFNLYWNNMLEKIRREEAGLNTAERYRVEVANIQTPDVKGNYSGSGEGVSESYENGSGEAFVENDENFKVIVSDVEEVVEDTKYPSLPLPQQVIDLLACRQGPKGEPGVDGIDGEIGEPGANGTIGEPGIKGEPGLDGLDGEKGEPGANGTIGEPGIKGETGAPGRDGLAGLKGATGRDGLAGARGAKGETGQPGLPGIAGLKGERGYPGFDGMKGARGMPGLAGRKGVPGPAGLDGVKGEPGLPGLQGAPGLKGLPGSPGKDGAEVIIPDLFPADVISSVLNTTLLMMERGGLRGPPGLDGLPGPNGTDGTPGADGVPGTDGAPGAEGRPGADGAQGPPGPMGPQGPAGIPGSPGTDGTNGRQFIIFWPFEGSSSYFVKDNILYGFYSEKKTWHDAQSFCQGKRGTLIQLKDNVILTRAAAETDENIWTGGKRNSFNWFVWTGTNERVPGNLWNSGEPNNSGGVEDCAEMTGRKLNDLSCSRERAFACQKTIS